jgi:hypothetical protein
VSYPPPAPAPRSQLPLWVLGGLVVVLAGTLAVVLLTRPSGNSQAAVAAAAAVSEPTTTSAPATIGPSPTPVTGTTPASKTLKVGQTHTFASTDGNKAAVTVLKHQAHEDTYGIQVRTCNRGSTMFVASPYPWFLSYSNGEELSQDSVTGGGLLAPEFTQGDLEPGGCRKGWLSFVRSGKPDGAEYRLEGETRVRWEW